MQRINRSSSVALEFRILELELRVYAEPQKPQPGLPCSCDGHRTERLLLSGMFLLTQRKTSSALLYDPRDAKRTCDLIGEPERVRVAPLFVVVVQRRVDGASRRSPLEFYRHISQSTRPTAKSPIVQV
ncbi:hypothetical protein PI125_g1965 [Phytophthora idaei]|nr:hypothetical protein PI125_g1965 [Phytophthora idaei]KAG3169290.1 hypothetical protein PI126_g2881 [Phytophthora idaei]